MRIITLLFSFFLCLSISNAQSKLTAAQWQEDLRFLQKTVHKDYSFLFKKVTQSEFDQQVDKLYQEIPNLEEHEIIVGLARIVALFKYGHTAIWIPGWHPNEQFEFHKMPFNLYHFSDGVYIQGTHKKDENALGAKVSGC